MIVTNNNKINKKLKLIRNHGLVDRNNIKFFGVNSRLDTLQAIVANHLLPKLKNITFSRIKNANYLDDNLKHIKQIYIPKREKSSREVFHLYCIQVKNRDKLARF